MLREGGFPVREDIGDGERPASGRNVNVWGASPSHAAHALLPRLGTSALRDLSDRVQRHREHRITIPRARSNDGLDRGGVSVAISDEPARQRRAQAAMWVLRLVPLGKVSAWSRSGTVA